MKWGEQKDRVDTLAAQAQSDADAMIAHRRALKQWSKQTFGTAEALAWSFAAGTAFGILREQDPEKSRARRTAGAAAKASLFAWRVAKLPLP